MSWYSQEDSLRIGIEQRGIKEGANFFDQSFLMLNLHE
jgi:hypothetical protein